MQRSRTYPKSSPRAPRQEIDEAQLRRVQTADQHGLPIGIQLTGGSESRSYVDWASYNVNGN